MSIGTKIMGAILALSITLGLRLAIDGWSAWQDAAVAALQLERNAEASRLAVAAGTMAQERGLTNGALADPASRTPATLAAIRARRLAADAVLGDEPALRAPLATLAAARRAADDVLAGTPPAPGAPPWFATATTAIDAIVAMRRGIDGSLSTGSEITLPTTLRDRLAEASEFAGRERGMLNGLIAAGAPLTPAQISTLGMVRGRIDGAWAAIDPLLAQTPPELAAAVSAARRDWHEGFGPLHDAVLRAGIAGAAWPVPAAEWWAASTRAVDALLTAQATAGRAVDTAFQQRRSARNTSLGLAIGIAVLVAGIAGSLMLYVRLRVVRPVVGTVAIVDALAGGNLDVAVPQPRGRDEVARLLAATSQFRDTARQARALAAEQTSLRAEAEAARAATIRDIGGVIEQASTEAIGGVLGMAEEMRQLGDKVHASIDAIATRAARASDDAALSLRGSDSAAAGAAELSGAIREIAQQMERAAGATRAAVSRVEAAQRVFDALSNGVAEISEVAGLIREIAGRTNLLALNATIEAARAGESGRGFAVVAGEVKALAQETSRSTERIARQLDTINAVNRQATDMMGEITAAVGDLDGIAASVAAAIEEQAIATSGIAASVGSVTEAVQRVSIEMSGVADETTSSEQASGDMARLTGTVAARVAGLKAELVRLMRSRVADLDRRQTPRRAVRRASRLEFQNRRLTGEIVDLSAGGTRFEAATPVDLPAGAELRIVIDGLPPITARVVSVAENFVHLAFNPADATERERLAAAVDRLAA